MMFENEKVSDVFVKEGGSGKSTTAYRRRYPKVTGSASIEIECVGDLESSDGLTLEGAGKGFQTRRICVAECKMIPSIPEEE